MVVKGVAYFDLEIREVASMQYTSKDTMSRQNASDDCIRTHHDTRVRSTQSK